MKAISTTSNDGGVSILTGVADAMLLDYEFTTKSGTRDLTDGTRVRVASDHTPSMGAPGKLYGFVGPSETNVNLANEDFTNTTRWTLLNTTNIIPTGYNVTDSDSEAFGGLVVRNELKSDVDAYLDHVTLSAGAVDLSAIENATLVAFNESVAKSSGGSAYGSGTSLAIGGMIVTNNLLGSSEARVTESALTTTATGTSGDIDVVAKNTATMDATNRTMIQTGDTAGGATLAFNTLGWQPGNLLFDALSSFLSTDIGTESPSNATAYSDGYDGERGRFTFDLGEQRCAAECDAKQRRDFGSLGVDQCRRHEHQRDPGQQYGKCRSDRLHRFHHNGHD